MPITTQNIISRQASGTTGRTVRYPMQRSQFSLRQRTNASDAKPQIGIDDNQPYDPLRSMPGSVPGNQGREGVSGTTTTQATPTTAAQTFSRSQVTNPAIMGMFKGKAPMVANAMLTAPVGISPVTAGLASVANPASLAFSIANTMVPAGIAGRNLARTTQETFDQFDLTPEEQKDIVSYVTGKAATSPLSPQRTRTVKGIMDVESKLAKEEATPYMTRATRFGARKLGGLLGLPQRAAMRQSDAEARMQDAERGPGLDVEAGIPADLAAGMQSDEQARENEAQNLASFLQEETPKKRRTELVTGFPVRRKTPEEEAEERRMRAIQRAEEAQVPTPVTPAPITPAPPGQTEPPGGGRLPPSPPMEPLPPMEPQEPLPRPGLPDIDIEEGIDAAEVVAGWQSDEQAREADEQHMRDMPAEPMTPAPAMEEQEPLGRSRWGNLFSGWANFFSNLGTGTPTTTGTGGGGGRSPISPSSPPADPMAPQEPLGRESDTSSTGGSFDPGSDPTGMGSEAEAAADAGSDSDSDSDSSWFCTAVNRTFELDTGSWFYLTQFRRMANTYYPKTLDFYVVHGPAIMKKVTKKDLRDMAEKLIFPVVKFMKAGDFDSAFFHYAKWVLYYIRKYLPEKTQETIDVINLARSQCQEDIPIQ